MTYFNKEYLLHIKSFFKSNYSIEKWTKDMKGQFTEDKIPMDNYIEKTLVFIKLEKSGKSKLL